MQTFMPSSSAMGSQAAKPAFNPLEAILKKVSNNLADVYSQQATEAVTAGVPASDILGTLSQLMGVKQPQAQNLSGTSPQTLEKVLYMIQQGGMGGQQGNGSGQPQPPQPPNMPVGVDDPSRKQRQTPTQPVGIDPISQALGGAAPAQPQMAPQASQPAQSPQSPQIIDPGFFGRMFGNAQVKQNGDVVIGGKLNPFATQDYQLKGAQELIQGQQKISGQEPIQPKDLLSAETSLGVARGSAAASLLKNDMTRMDTFFTNLNKAPSGEVGKSLMQLDSGINAADQMLDILEKNPGSFSRMNVIGDAFGQQLGTLATQLKSAILRGEGGATLTNSEIEMVKKISPKTGLSAFGEDPRTAMFKLQQIRNKMDNGRKIYRPDQSTREMITTMQKAGHTKQSIWEFLKTQGEM